MTMKRYSLNKATGTMLPAPKGRYVTFAQHDAEVQSLLEQVNELRAMVLKGQMRSDGYARLSDGLVTLMDTCQDMHRAAADVAQRIGAIK